MERFQEFVFKGSLSFFLRFNLYLALMGIKNFLEKKNEFMRTHFFGLGRLKLKY